ncbi:MAG: nicotinamide mononucleotide transporter [Bacteroidales bacterium]|nr:nicotinamide mononucleotide transporter [Bacteroidales bacterium]
MTVIQAIEIFALVTGVAYVVLEILQKNAMWVLGILTGAACAFSFGVQHVWASMGLNLYYVVISFIGLAKWRKDGARVAEGAIHLRALPKKVALWSACIFVLGSLAMIFLLRAIGDAEPRLDGAATVLSIIGTWWLAQSYLQQWLIWIVADIITTTLCIVTGQYWMALLYLAYIASAIYGFFHWRKKGVYLK